MMNRQLRRAQQKQDERFDKERQKKKDKRQEKLASLRERRAKRREEARARAAARARGETVASEKKDAESGAKGSGTKRRPGRFSAALMMATVFFIVLQSAVPPDSPGELDVLRSVTSAGFYLLFAYFSTLWLMRRDTPRPVLMTLISGGMLTLGVEVAKRFQSEMTTDWLMLALAVPFLAAGAFLGRLVYVNSPT
jgi:hypothetical protein